MYSLILVLFMVGFLIRLRYGQVFRAVKTINQCIVYSSFPATVFLSMIAVDFSNFSGFSVLSVWVVQIVCFALVWFCGRLMNWPRAVIGAFMIVCVLGNTSFMGYPLVSNVLGEQALPYAVFYDQFGSFLALSIGLPILLAIFSNQASPSLVSIAFKVIKFPPFLAMLLGLLLHGIDLGYWLDLSLKTIALTMAPLAALVIGLQFKLDFTDKQLIFTGLTIKMIIPPILVWVLGLNLQPNVIEMNASVLQAAMPPMMTASILVMASGLATQSVAALLSMGMLLSLVTLPAVIFWVL